MNSRWNKIAVTLLTVVAALIIGAGVAEACPGCGEALPGHVSEGFNKSVLFLMAMPFFVAGSVAFGVLIISRNKKSGLDTRSRNESFNEIEETES